MAVRVVQLVLFSNTFVQLCTVTLVFHHCPHGEEVIKYLFNLLSCLTNFKNVQKRSFPKTRPSLGAEKRN